MNLVYALHSLEDLKTLKEQEAKSLEVIVGCRELSRYFSYSLAQAMEAAKHLKEWGYKVFFQWDILMTERAFVLALSDLKKVNWSLFDSVRVQDPGAMLWLKEHRPSASLQLIVETGNHNAKALHRWQKLAGGQLERLIVSAELNHQILLSLREEIESSIALEVQAVGKLLLFYTPRQLLSPLSDEEHNGDWVQALGTSEESPHKGFPLVENRHGTFMFNTKDLFIFDEHEEVQKLAATENFYFRCDESPLKLENLTAYIQGPSAQKAAMLRQEYEQTTPVIKGFFRVNKTDVLFKKLKNSRLQERDDNLIGEVVEVKKKKHVAIHLKEKCSCSVGEGVRFLSPEGKSKDITLPKMFNGAGQEITEGKPGQVIFIAPIGGVSVRTQIYKIS